VLLSRGAHGVTPTDEALRILPELEQAMSHLERAFKGGHDESRVLNCAGPSFLVSLLLPVIAQALPRARLYALELPPAILRSMAPENQFEISLIAGRVNLPRSWHLRAVGQVRRGLFARPRLAQQLQPFPVEPARLMEWPFITPIYTLNGQFVQADDDCPLGFAERKLGHKTQTLRVALDLAAEVDQLLFAPIVAARDQVEAGRLVEVPVSGWHVTDPLTLACNPGRLLAHEFNAVAAAVELAAREC
jgi:DNA-binding transcriptional LysR family regulator